MPDEEKEADKSKANREYKSDLFSGYFSDPANRKHLLSLYNAVNETAYTDEKKIELTTISTVLYNDFHNDLSFVFIFTMNSYEHQSTYCRNMPFRSLVYSSRMYGPYAAANEKKLYKDGLLKIPKPDFVIFYNGRKKMPEKWTEQLSDAYEHGEDITAEITVTWFNINYGKGYRILEDYPALKEYAWFVDAVRRKIKSGTDTEEAVAEAIREMPDDYEMKTYLKNLKEEHMQSIFEEFNDELYIQGLCEDAREEGIEKGINGIVRRVYRSFITKGLSEESAAEQTAEITDYSLSQIRQILNDSRTQG